MMGADCSQDPSGVWQEEINQWTDRCSSAVTLIPVQPLSSTARWDQHHAATNIAATLFILTHNCTNQSVSLTSFTNLQVTEKLH